MIRLVFCLVLIFISHAISAADFISLPESVPLPDKTSHALGEAKTAKGSPTWKLVFFGYTNCTDICPMSAANAHKIARSLRAQGLDIGNVFITLDQERDSDEALRNYFSVYPDTFSYIRADQETMNSLKASFGVEMIAYNKNPQNSDYVIDHSTNTFLVYKDREIVAVLDLFEHDLDHLKVEKNILERTGMLLAKQEGL